MILKIPWAEHFCKKREFVPLLRYGAQFLTAYRYLTVDYERGNFTVSQCVWQDGAAEQITTILSPTYANISSNSMTSSTSRSKPLGGGVIAGAVIGGIAVVVIAGGIGYYISRRRNRPTSKSPTEDIGLTNLEPGENKDAKYGSVHDPNSPYPPFKKLDSTGSVHRSADGENQPQGELGTQGEIFQLPTQRDQEDYFTAVNRIASERRAERTPQIDGRSVVYELQGSEPPRVEMDDEQSRRGLPLSPAVLSPTSTRLSPVSARLSPVSSGLSQLSAGLSPISAGRLTTLPFSRENSRPSSFDPTSYTI